MWTGLIMVSNARFLNLTTNHDLIVDPPLDKMVKDFLLELEKCVDEKIEAEAMFVDTGDLTDKNPTLHDNVYTIKYDPKTLKDIFMSQYDKDNVPDMYLAEFKISGCSVQGNPSQDREQK